MATLSSFELFKSFNPALENVIDSGRHIGASSLNVSESEGSHVGSENVAWQILFAEAVETI